MHKLINDLFSKSVPCSTSMTQRQPPGAHHLLSPEAHLEDAAHKSLSSKPLPSSALDPLPTPPPPGSLAPSRFAPCLGYPPPGCLRHQRAGRGGEGVGEPLGRGRSPGNQHSRTGEPGRAGEGIPAQRDPSLAFGSGWQLALILGIEMAGPPWESGPGHAEASSGTGAPLFLNSCLHLWHRV